MEYKFYKVTTGVFIDRVTKAVADREDAIKQLRVFQVEVGATDAFQYNRGGVAYFTFDKKPCMTLWKKTNDGFLPRLGTKDGKALNNKLAALPKVKAIADCLDVLKLDNMMVLGEMATKGFGVRMHSASFCGKHESKTYFIKVPQEKGKEFKPESSDLVECKEWEMLKFMEEE